MNKKKIISLIPVIMIMAAIFMFSAQNGVQSSHMSDGISDKISDMGFTGNITFIVRKSAHFIIYALLGFFTLLHLECYRLKKSGKVIISLLICFLYAASDEFHQLFVSGRSGQFSDVILDTLGSLSGIIVMLCIGFLYKKRR